MDPNDPIFPWAEPNPPTRVVIIENELQLAEKKLNVQFYTHLPLPLAFHEGRVWETVAISGCGTYAALYLEPRCAVVDVSTVTLLPSEEEVTRRDFLKANIAAIAGLVLTVVKMSGLDERVGQYVNRLRRSLIGRQKG